MTLVPTTAPTAAKNTPIRFALHFAFRSVVCLVTFLVVFSLCEAAKDLLLR
jgi:hypothetical protein